MEEDVKAAFGRIWPAHVANLTRFLIACRTSFDDDLDLFLVLAVIGERTFSASRPDAKMDYEAFRAGRAAQSPDFSINLRSVAAFSGIPRETVRRKLATLEKKGWISRDAGGNLRATARAAADLEPLTEAGIQYISAMLKLLTTQLPGAGRNDAAPKD